MESRPEASEFGMDSAPEGGRSQTDQSTQDGEDETRTRAEARAGGERDKWKEVGEQGNRMSTSPGRTPPDHRAKNQARRVLFIRGWSTAFT